MLPGRLLPAPNSSLSLSTSFHLNFITGILVTGIPNFEGLPQSITGPRQSSESIFHEVISQRKNGTNSPLSPAP